MAKSKRERKISKVMGEFKEGTLKSGGSSRKVTNPKQAIAIALSEANAMNQGGMMYNEIMNRPMFQTPQMREGGGIMAGVAPIRGYADGDLVEGDNTFRPISAFADFLRNPREVLGEETSEAISNLTPEDALAYLESNPGEAAAVAILTAFPFLRAGKAGLQAFRASQARRRTGPNAKMSADDLAPPPSGKRVMNPKDIEGTTIVPTKVKPTPGRVARAATAVSKSPVGATGRGIAAILKNPVKSTAGAAALGGIYTLAQEYFPDLEIEEAVSALYQKFPEAFRDIISPDVGERVELTEYAESRLPEVATARKEGFPEQPKAPPPPPPDPTFLDMLKGAGTQFKDFLQDPANQYALARASQPREGIAPMNFASDFAVGKEEYKQLEAQRENDTALMRNYQFLKETTDLSDKEIVSRLSNEATARDEFLTLFSEAVDTAGSVTPEQIAQFEAITGYTLPEEARVRLGVAAAPSDDID